MNATIFWTTLRQRLASRVRLVLVGAVFLFPLLFINMAREVGLAAIQTAPAFAFLLGAGILGQETASGVMQLLFARPIRRWEYVIARWLAVIAGAIALYLVQFGIACLMLAAHGLPSTREIGIMLAEQAVQAIGTASVILFFSSLISGFGDVLGIVLTFVSAQILGAVGQLFNKEWVVRVSAEILRFITPKLAIGPMLLGNGIPWFEVVSYLSTVTLCLAVAVVVLNQREISYASD